jgi:hypothetical protein
MFMGMGGSVQHRWVRSSVQRPDGNSMTRAWQFSSACAEWVHKTDPQDVLAHRNCCIATFKPSLGGRIQAGKHKNGKQFEYDQRNISFLMDLMLKSSSHR